MGTVVSVHSMVTGTLPLPPLTRMLFLFVMLFELIFRNQHHVCI